MPKPLEKKISLTVDGYMAKVMAVALVEARDELEAWLKMEHVTDAEREAYLGRILRCNLAIGMLTATSKTLRAIK